MNKIYKQKFGKFVDWCEKNNIGSDPPPLPYPKVQLKDGSFHPQVLDNVKEGDFVTWVNRDSSRHRIVSGRFQEANAGQEFDSADSDLLSLTAVGKAFSHEFVSQGNYEYFCLDHPNSKEKGKIVVKSSYI